MNTRAAGSTPDIDFGDVGDRRVVAIGRVPANSRVLDLRLADGSVARSLKAMGCCVWGVRRDRDADGAVSDLCDKVIDADLESSDLLDALGNQTFDVLLMLDVLEYLPDPAELLSRLAKVVADNGWGVISLSNGAQESLDRAQLHFFDRRRVDDLLEEAGWRAFDMGRVLKGPDRAAVGSGGGDRDQLRPLESDVEALTDHFVLAAAPHGSPVLTRPPLLPAAVAQAALFEVRQHMAELGYAVHARRHQLPDLIEQLDEIRDKTIERKRKLRDILVAIRQP